MFNANLKYLRLYIFRLQHKKKVNISISGIEYIFQFFRYSFFGFRDFFQNTKNHLLFTHQSTNNIRCITRNHPYSRKFVNFYYTKRTKKKLQIKIKTHVIVKPIHSSLCAQKLISASQFKSCCKYHIPKRCDITTCVCFYYYCCYLLLLLFYTNCLLNISEYFMGS